MNVARETAISVHTRRVGFMGSSPIRRTFTSYSKACTAYSLSTGITKSELSRDAIVKRALDLADGEGLDAVTIRRLGQEFGVTPMALYWHVKNKDELLEAMGDRLFVGLDYATPADAPWYEQLRAVVHALATNLRAHPTCVDLAYQRIFSCEEGRRISEYAFGLLRRA